MKDTLLMLGWTVGFMFLGVLVGAAITYKAADRMRGAAYVQGVLDCEQFHALQQSRDQLQGIDMHPKRIGG